MEEKAPLNCQATEACYQNIASQISSPHPEIPDCCRHKHREQSDYEALLKRLNRIEGQVRGVRGMVEKECYCTDILTQVSAIQSALNAFSRELLANHIRTCVKDGIHADDDNVIEELVRTVEKLMK